MTLEMIGKYLLAFLESFQFRSIGGLILLDVVLGIAVVLRVGKFDWEKIATFYRTNVIPYILGYAVTYVGLYVALPATGVGPLTDGIVTIAWGMLMASLLGSVWASLRTLYPVLPPLPLTGPKVDDPLTVAEAGPVQPQHAPPLHMPKIAVVRQPPENPDNK